MTPKKFTRLGNLQTGPLTKSWDAFYHNRFCFVFMQAQSTFITSLTVDVTNRIKYHYPNLTDEGKGLTVTFKGYQILS